MKNFFRLLVAVAIINCSPVFAGETTVADIQKRWAVANYQLAGDEQAAAFEKLIEDATLAVSENSGNADYLIWKAIVESTYAGKASGLSPLGLVKAAKADLEQALDIDPMALEGSAYTSLGALYYQVPGWPIAFGSSKKAEKFLKKALEINPEGIDPNYFYGAFMVEEKEWNEAKIALERALKAPERPDRPIADAGRRDEIRALLQEISAKAA